MPRAPVVDILGMPGWCDDGVLRDLFDLASRRDNLMGCQVAFLKRSLLSHYWALHARMSLTNQRSARRQRSVAARTSPPAATAGDIHGRNQTHDTSTTVVRTSES